MLYYSHMGKLLMNTLQFKVTKILLILLKEPHLFYIND